MKDYAASAPGLEAVWAGNTVVPVPNPTPPEKREAYKL
jgi:hypothetical protein